MFSFFLLLCSQFQKYFYNIVYNVTNIVSDNDVFLNDKSWYDTDLRHMPASLYDYVDMNNINIGFWVQNLLSCVIYSLPWGEIMQL